MWGMRCTAAAPCIIQSILFEVCALWLRLLISTPSVFCLCLRILWGMRCTAAAPCRIHIILLEVCALRLLLRMSKQRIQLNNKIGGMRLMAAPSAVSLPNYDSVMFYSVCVNFWRLVDDIFGGTRLMAAPSIVSLPKYDLVMFYSVCCVSFLRLVGDVIGGTRLRVAPSIVSLANSDIILSECDFCFQCFCSFLRTRWWYYLYSMCSVNFWELCSFYTITSESGRMSNIKVLCALTAFCFGSFDDTIGGTRLTAAPSIVS